MKNAPLITAIPARYDSSRFPGKPLAPIAGESLISRVYRNCPGEAWVITDDARIESHVLDFGGRVVRIDDAVPTGGDRVYLAWQRHWQESGAEFILNLQGDWPTIERKDLLALVDFHSSSNFDVTTLVSPGPEGEERNRSKVKAIFSPPRGQCLYFSRAEAAGEWFLHAGVYCYRTEALTAFGSAPPSLWEQKEGLEQLRVLELGMTIGALSVERKLMGVDRPEDIRAVEDILGGQ